MKLKLPVFEVTLMRAMVLSAGLGKRMRGFEKELPKPLVRVLGKPLIYYSLELLKEAQIKEVMVNLHYKPEKIIDVLGDGSSLGLKIFYSYEKTLLGSGGGIKKVEDFFGNEPFVVMNADTIIELALRDVIEFHFQKKGIATMVLVKEDTNKYQPVFVDLDGMVRSIRRNPSHLGIKGEELVFGGVHILEPEMLSYLPSDIPCSIIEEGYWKVLEEGRAVWAYKASGFFFAVDDANVLKEAEKFFLGKQQK